MQMKKFTLLVFLSVLFLILSIRSTETLGNLASQILETCKTSSYRAACYDTEIPKLMNKISMEKAFKVTAEVQRLDPGYQFCHVVGHKLAAREVDKNPNKWKEIIPRCPSGLCSDGCIHGTFQEKFKIDTVSDLQFPSFAKDFNTICDINSWNPTGFEKDGCYHGLGHLAMYVTRADIMKAVNLCKSLGSLTDERTLLCFDGAFMQIFQPIEPEDFSLAYAKGPSPENLASYCSTLPEPIKSACITEGFTFFREKVLTSDGVVDYCKTVSPELFKRCLFIIETALVPIQKNDVSIIASYCQGFPGDLKAQCFVNDSLRLLENDYRSIGKAVKLCSLAIPESLSDECFKGMTSGSNYVFRQNSKEFKDFCKAVPSSLTNLCKKTGGINES